MRKLRRTPPAAPRRKLEEARLGSVKRRPRRAEVAGCMEERLSRRPVARSAVYRRALKVCLRVCNEVVWPRSPLPDKPSETQSTSRLLKVCFFSTSHCTTSIVIPYRPNLSRPRYIARPGFHGAFVRRKRGVRRLRPPREQGRQWHDTLVATAPERQPRTLQRGKHWRLAIFGGRLRACLCGS